MKRTPTAALWFMAYPPVEEENPSWEAGQVYSFRFDGMRATTARLPEIGFLVTEGGVHGQIITSMIRRECNRGGLLPLAMFNALALADTSTAGHAMRAEEIRRLSQSASAECPVVVVLPPPTLKGIYDNLGRVWNGRVEPLSVAEADYNPAYHRIIFRELRPRLGG